MKKVWFLAIIMSLSSNVLFAGCSEGNQIYKKAVNEYNVTLVNVFETGDIDLLNGVATEKETRRMHLFLSYLNDENKKLSAKLKAIKFGSVRINQPETVTDKAYQIPGKPVKNYVDVEIKTWEKWEYKYLDSKTNELVEGPASIEYNVTYSLVKPEDKWVVNEVYFEEKILK